MAKKARSPAKPTKTPTKSPTKKVTKKARRPAKPAKSIRPIQPPAPAKRLGPAKPAARPPRPKKPESSAKKTHTTEENRGGHFFSAIRMWRILHEDQGETLFNKELLARRFYEGLEDEENPEPEVLEELNYDELNMDPDAMDPDGPEQDAPDPDDHEIDLDDDPSNSPEAWGVRMHQAGPAAKPKTQKPYEWIKERHKRAVQRIVEKLKKYGIGIDDVDENGRILDEDEFTERQQGDPWAERWWRYNPNGEWAKDFSTLLKTYGINAGQLVALMALRDLLEDLRGTPHQKALADMLDELEESVPPKLLEDAIEQSRAYRHSVGNTAKYEKKSEDLSRWYAAALHHQQVKIEYTTPGSATRVRHVAALGTVFHREENAIYLLASEQKGDGGWHSVRQWKFDRVKSVQTTGLPNPKLSEIPPDPLVRSAPGSHPIERLDNERIYFYSGGAWLEVGTEPKRLEVVVRVPVVKREGLPEGERRRLESEDRRRAYGWMMWCREKPFHPRQMATTETRPDGEEQLRLVVERCYVKDMASRLLRLQDCFEVIEPPELISLLQQYGNAICSRHGG